MEILNNSSESSEDIEKLSNNQIVINVLNEIQRLFRYTENLNNKGNLEQFLGNVSVAKNTTRERMSQIVAEIFETYQVEIPENIANIK